MCLELYKVDLLFVVAVCCAVVVANAQDFLELNPAFVACKNCRDKGFLFANSVLAALSTGAD